MLNQTSLQPLAEAQALLNERYELLTLIGEGGFGQVFKARQSVTGHEVAVKLLRPPQGGAERWADQQKHLARFQREMRICARLFHPHIVRPIDSGQLEDGRLYSVFEFVPGQNLAQVLAQEGPLEPREAIRLMIQILDALDCAHQRGVVHRDIKPHNIMITDTGARRNALVLDFGLSTLTDEFRTESDSGISSILEFMGTPSYAAPEQLKSQHPDMRSDLYSWGLVHIECLTGERVMQGNSLQEVIQKQLGPEPVPFPSTLEGLRLGELLRRATEKNLDKRNVTAGDLLRELETCAQDEGGKLSRRFAMARARSGGSPDKASEASTSSRLPEGQLRHITALCCEMSLPSLSTSPLDVDIEERANTLQTLQKRCIEIAEELGGYVGGVLGQQVMFYFGYPTAQEEAPRNAARAALRLLDDTTSSTSESEPRLELRIGIHTGPALIQEPNAEKRQELPNVQGTTPMIASQYQQMSEPGEALVSPDTYRLLRNRFAFEFVRRLEPHTRRPLEVSRLHQERATDLSRSEPPLVGRANELALLRHRWELVRQGVGQCALLTGEPGIGKSRLVRELRRELRATPHSVMECRCAPEERSSALRPIIGLLEGLLGRRPDWSPERCQSELEGLLSRYDFELEETFPLFATLLSIPLGERYQPPQDTPDWVKALTFNAVLNLLVEMAAQQPVLLVLEDLHWADPTTLELLTFLLDAVPTARLGVILTARSEFVPPWPPAQMFQLQLGRLERSRVDELLAGLTGGKALPPEVVEQIASRTDGIPLFVEELTRLMLESGVLKEKAGSYELAGPLDRLAIPTTLHGLLEARLDRLGRAKKTAELAAFLGREFSYELLRALFPHDERTLQADLSALVAAELLQYRRRLHHPTYVFKHALLRDAAYESVPRTARREIHARIASVLEKRFPALVEAQPEMLAHHHAAAEQKREALRYAQRAAQAALRRAAYREALAQTREALGWLDALQDIQERAKAELDLLGILLPTLIVTQQRDSSELDAVIRRAQELLDVLGESEHVFSTLWALVSFHWGRGLADQALELARRHLDLALRKGDLGRQVAARALLGACLFCVGRLEEATLELAEALRLHDPQAHRDHLFIYGRDSRLLALAYLAATLVARGRLDQGLALCTELETWAQELHNPATTGAALYGLCGVFSLYRARERIPPLSDELRRLVKTHGFTPLLGPVELMRAWAEQDAGAVEGILAMIPPELRTLGLSVGKAQAAEVLASRDQRARARGLLQEALAQQHDGSTYYLAEMLRLDGELLRSEDPRAAEARLHEAADTAREQGALLFELRAHHSLAELLLEQGRREEARHTLERVLDRFTEHGQHPDLSNARSLLESTSR